MKFSSISFLAAVFSSPPSTPLFGGSSSVVVITASAIVEAVKKESGREKREGQGRLLGAFSKADSLRETLLERKNKKPRKERSLAKEVAMSSEHVTKLVVLRLKINRAMGDEHAFSLPELLSRKAAVSEEDDYDMCALAPGAHIGKESCIGDYVCAKRDGSKIGKGSCQGFRSCYADFYYRNYTVVDGAGGNIGDGSCNNARSCYSFRGTVGNDSCNSYRACAGGQGTVHDGSCGRSDSSDDYACKDMRGTVHDNSCNGFYACLDTYGRIGKDSCNDIAACVRSSTFIGDKSCNEVEACRGVYGYEIGSCACNMYEECSCEGGEEGYYCDNSGDVFTDAQKSTCKSAKSGKGREGDRGTASANIFSPDD
eukprot:g5328.t1 g5328   contig2:280426-283612(-)